MKLKAARTIRVGTSLFRKGSDVTVSGPVMADLQKRNLVGPAPTKESAPAPKGKAEK
ncbi:hypothetical protein [Cereibacter sphaeroides]|jgi:hypothetical protein|uniref:hypothetical protein n=1 Tax=Cereibacter sphaeroides TaxID=1063 RepID=UPI0002FAC5CE